MPESNGIPDFVPVSEWPTLHDLCEGFSEHLLPDSNKMSGRHIELIFEDGNAIDHHFKDPQALTWQLNAGSEIEQKGDAEYRAFEVRAGIFFVDFYKPTYQEQVTLVLDDSSGQAIAAISGFHNLNGVKRTYTRFANARIKGSGFIEPFQPTTDMIGKHILYRYTSADAYEHIYLNRGTFTWHCLSGTEKGLADTEPCKMLKLGDELYLLFWTEKIMPVESVVVVDLKQLRSTGRFFCWDPKHDKAVGTLFGSYATILGQTNATKLFK